MPDPQEIVPERVLESRRLFEGRIVNLRVDSVELGDGTRSSREVVEHGAVVAIVPLDGDGNVLLVRQYRLPIGQTTLEIPAGGVDAGESAEEAVRRELREETGCDAARLLRLGGFYASPGHCSEYIHVFLATGLTDGEPQRDFDEHIAVERRPLAEAVRLIAYGEIRDAKSVIGLLLAERYLSP
ncbi:MAG: NUDIX hydrolase [Chloroflexi bacterium]|nr:NUDIX hydrolase [Chloroflexota bacterium]